nr:CYP4BY3 protein [Diaphanosoma celebensis]
MLLLDLLGRVDIGFGGWMWLLLALLLVRYLAWLNGRFVRLIEAIPGPRGVPFFGILFQVSDDHAARLATVQRRWVADHGPIYRAWAGPRPLVALSSPELMEPILSSQKHISKGFEYSFLKAWLGDCMFLTTGARWKSRRRLLTPAFHFQILSSFFDVFNEQSRVLVDILERIVDQQGDQPTDIFPIVTKCALDIICETSMGRQVRSSQETDVYLKSLHRIGGIAMERGARPWLVNDWLFSLSSLGRENRRCIDTLHRFTKQVIRDRRQALRLDAKVRGDGCDAPRERLAFLDLLLTAAANGADLSDDDIREEVDTVMFAGHDTTASSMTWFLHCISKHPEVQRKLLDEVDAIFGDSDRPCSTHDATELKYLECCVKEALRLYPSVPFVMRRLTEDVRTGDYTLPAGVTVAMLIFGMHRNPRVFDDPDQFRPERFLPENSAGRHPFAFIPFSAGPRNCIGQKYGLLEVKVVLSTLLRRFRFSSGDGSSALYHPSSQVVLKPVGPVPVVVHRRRDKPPLP